MEYFRSYLEIKGRTSRDVPSHYRMTSGHKQTDSHGTAACDELTNLIIMTCLHRLNIRTVLDKALDTVAEVLPDTPRIEVDFCRHPARALALRMIFK